MSRLLNRLVFLAAFAVVAAISWRFAVFVDGLPPLPEPSARYFVRLVLLVAVFVGLFFSAVMAATGAAAGRLP